MPLPLFLDFFFLMTDQADVKLHPWVLRGLEDPDSWLRLHEPGYITVTVDDDDVNSAFTLTISQKLKNTASRIKNKLFHSSSFSSKGSATPRPTRTRRSFSGVLTSASSTSSTPHPAASSTWIPKRGDEPFRRPNLPMQPHPHPQPSTAVYPPPDEPAQPTQHSSRPPSFHVPYPISSSLTPNSITSVRRGQFRVPSASSSVASDRSKVFYTDDDEDEDDGEDEEGLEILVGRRRESRLD